MGQRTSLARAGGLNRGGSGQGVFQDGLKAAGWPMELGSQETYPVISCSRLQHKVTNHHTKSKSQERATELREGWMGEEFKATGSCDLVEAAMTANEKPYGEVPSSQPLMAAESDQAGGRGLCKCTFWKHTCSVVPGAGDWLRGAALRPSCNLVPEDLGGPTAVCSTVGLACSDSRPVGPQTSIQNTLVVAPSQPYTSLYK